MSVLPVLLFVISSAIILVGAVFVEAVPVEAVPVVLVDSVLFPLNSEGFNTSDSGFNI